MTIILYGKADGPSGGCSVSIGGVLTISREDVLTPMSDISQSVCEERILI